MGTTPQTMSLAQALQVAVGHHQAGRLAEAEGIYRQILAAAPEHPDALHLLGLVARQTGKPEVAVELIGKALKHVPGYAEAHNNLGNALKDQGKEEEAAASYRRAVELKPGYAEAHNNLGDALWAQGKLEEAAACTQQALALRPDYAEAHYSLGNARKGQGRLEEAAASYRRAIELKPDYAEAFNNLGAVAQKQGDLDTATACCRRAIELKPAYADAHYNLGIVLKDQGQLTAAVASCRQALALKPDSLDAHSNLIFTLDMDVAADTAIMQAERRRWSEMHVAGIVAEASHANVVDPERRLRIGYVSADFREHSATVVFGAMLVDFDRAGFDVYAYSNSDVEDGHTRIFRNKVTHWRKIAGLTDEAVAGLIRQDGIDILVDLSGHSGGNRLQVFARKPAPIQITAWGYVGGTGLNAMDVFFADPVVVPPEERRHYTEAVRDLPNFISAWFPKPFPDINPLPALNAGGVTFGSFNRLCKVADEAYRTWAQVLLAVPGSRMVVKAVELEVPGVRSRVLGHFSQAGVDPARITLLGKSTWHEQMAAFNQVDISLDPYPHGGGVTTLEGLMMGVPVVTLRWPTIYGRLSASILTALELTDWIAETQQQYVDIAVRKAGDLKGLAELRQTLRPRFMASIIGDTAAYARAVEGEYRKLWREWCGRQRNV